MSPIFKSYRCFTVGSLEFLEITKRPLSPSPTSLLCSRRRPPTAPPPASWRGFPAINSPRAGTHASRRSSSTALLPRAGAPSLRHAPAEASRGRHPDTAVASPLQHQGPPIRAHFGNQSTVAFFSPHFFGRSPLRKPRTEPPPSASSPAKPRRGDTTSRLLYPKPNPLIEHSSSHEALKPV